MLTAEQIDHYEAFGFIVLRRLFAQHEMDVIGREFDELMEEDRQGEAFTGERRQSISGFVEKRPLLTRLVDDDRIYLPAEQLLGSDFVWVASDGNLYVADTGWHHDARMPGYGRIKVAFYVDPVTTENGCLRVIPGSHLQPLNDSLRDALIDLYASKTQDEQKSFGVEGKDLPAFALESEPGDVVIFNQDLFHASFGGKAGRRMFALSYFGKPTTDEQIAFLKRVYSSILTKNVPEQQYTPTDRLFTETFFDTNRPRIQRFVAQLKELGFT